MLRVRISLLVCLKVCCLSLIGVLPVLTFPTAPSIETGAGEWRQVTLCDGSLATLGPRTAISHRCSGKVRLIRQARGEAMFEVESDPARPFIVRTAMADIQAVGTAFGVDHRPERTSIATREGVVAVTRARSFWSSAPAESPQVSAGQHVVVQPWKPMIARDVNVSDELAWVGGYLVFDNVLLEEAIGELNRRNVVQIAMPHHPNAARLRVNGRFKIDDTDKFKRFMHGMLGAEKTRE